MGVIGGAAVEVERLAAAIRSLQTDVRDLKTWRQLVGAGGLIRATSIQGVVPPASGGTGSGGTATPLGSVTIWTNNSGAVRSQGDVVVRDGNRLFDVTAVQGDKTVIGVLDTGTVANGAEGQVRHNGYQSVVAVQNNVTAGDYLRASATSGRAETAGLILHDGVFGIALTTYSGGGAGTVAAYIFSPAIILGYQGLEFTLGDGASVIPVGVMLDFEVPFDLTIIGWTLVADQSGSLVIDLWKDLYANYPPTVADTVTGSEKPTLAAQVTNQDLALTTWTDVTWDRGEWIRLNIDSAATVLRATLSLRAVRR